eukprot:g7375.t1
MSSYASLTDADQATHSALLQGIEEYKAQRVQLGSAIGRSITRCPHDSLPLPASSASSSSSTVLCASPWATPKLCLAANPSRLRTSPSSPADFTALSCSCSFYFLAPLIHIVVDYLEGPFRNNLSLCFFGSGAGGFKWLVDLPPCVAFSIYNFLIFDPGFYLYIAFLHDFVYHNQSFVGFLFYHIFVGRITLLESKDSRKLR